MGLFKTNPFGHILFLKKWLIRILGLLTHRRFRGFNDLQIEGSEIIKNLPNTNVLFISNHQTYFACACSPKSGKSFIFTINSKNVLKSIYENSSFLLCLFNYEL